MCDDQYDPAPNIYIQIPPTSYVGLILRSTAVATASRSTAAGTRGYFDATVTKG